MTTRPKAQGRSITASHRNEHDDPKAVAAYMASLEHRLKPVLEAIRRTILTADSTITEGIKWKSPSFYCHGWFATANLRATNTVQIVLHHGAKVREDNTLRLTLDDPAHLLTWLSPDRATATFTSVEDFAQKQEAFHKIIQQWAKHQRQLFDAA